MLDRCRAQCVGVVTTIQDGDEPAGAMFVGKRSKTAGRRMIIRRFEGEAYLRFVYAIVLEAEGNVDESSDELFRFARVLEGNDELWQTLGDPRLPA